MEASLWKQTRGRIGFGFVAALLVLCGTLLRQPFLGADGASGTATYAHGILHLTIPYHADRRGTGQLTVEVLDPEDHVLGEIEKSLEVAEGSSRWQEQVRLVKPLPLDELVWNRVRYRFQYQDTRFADLQGTESISQLMRMPVLHILAQQSYLEGSRAAVRVVRIEGIVLAFAFLVSLVTGVVFGVFPAWRASRSDSSGLWRAGRGITAAVASIG
jgi:hypothetical protein